MPIRSSIASNGYNSEAEVEEVKKENRSIKRNVRKKGPRIKKVKKEVKENKGR